MENIDNIGGYSLALTCKYNEALKKFQKELENFPDDPIILYNIGVILQQLKRYDEAINSFEKSIAIRPMPFTLVNAGITYGIINEYRKAFNYFKKAIELDNNYTDAWFNMAVVINKIGEIEKSIEALNIVLKIDPNDIIAQEQLLKLRKKLKRIVKNSSNNFTIKE